MQDGLIDIVTVHGALHFGQLNWGVDKSVRIAKHAKFASVPPQTSHGHLRTAGTTRLPNGYSLRNKSTMLRRTVDSRGASILQMHDALEWAIRMPSSPDQRNDMSEVHRQRERRDDDPPLRKTSKGATTIYRPRYWEARRQLEKERRRGRCCGAVGMLSVLIPTHA